MDVEEFLSYCILQFCVFMPCSCHLHRCIRLSMSNLLSSLFIEHSFTCLASNILLLPPFNEATLCRVDSSTTSLSIVELLGVVRASTNFFSWAIHEYFATLFRSSTQLNNSLTICQQLSNLTSTPFKCSNTYNSRASQWLYHHSCHIHWNPFYFKYIPWNLDTSCLMLLHFISKLHDILSMTT